MGREELETEGNNFFGEFCYKGEQRKGSVAGGKVGVQRKLLMRKIIACLYTDNNVFVVGGAGMWRLTT